HRLSHAVLARRRRDAARGRGIVCALCRFARAVLRRDLALRAVRVRTARPRHGDPRVERHHRAAAAIRRTRALLPETRVGAAAAGAMGAHGGCRALPRADAGRGLCGRVRTSLPSAGVSSRCRRSAGAAAVDAVSRREAPALAGVYRVRRAQRAVDGQSRTDVCERSGARGETHAAGARRRRNANDDDRGRRHRIAHGYVRGRVRPRARRQPHRSAKGAARVARGRAAGRRCRCGPDARRRRSGRGKPRRGRTKRDRRRGAAVRRRRSRGARRRGSARAIAADVWALRPVRAADAAWRGHPARAAGGDERRSAGDHDADRRHPRARAARRQRPAGGRSDAGRDWARDGDRSTRRHAAAPPDRRWRCDGARTHAAGAIRAHGGRGRERAAAAAARRHGVGAVTVADDRGAMKDPARRPTVCFVAPSLAGGGAERVAVQVLNALDPERWNRCLYLFERRGPYLADVSPTIRVDAGDAVSRVGQWRELRRFLRARRPDVVVVFLSYFSVLTAARAAGISARVVFDVETPVSAFLGDAEYRWSRPWMRRLFTGVMRRACGAADLLRATSNGVADDLVRTYGASPSRVCVVPNPVDVTAIAKDAEEPLDAAIDANWTRPVIVAAGRLADVKNYPLLIDALAILRETIPASLFILGTGEHEAAIRSAIRDRALDGVVHLCGFQRNPWKFMARADVFALTSRYEGFGNV